MNQCPNCNESNRDGARFCRNCGQMLLAEAAITLVAEPPPAVEVSSVIDDLPAAELPPAGAVSEGPAVMAASSADDLNQEGKQVETTVLASLALPITIGGQYDLVEVIEQSDTHIIYRGFDRWCCGLCGARRTDMSEVYCWNCGVEVGQGAPRHLQAGNIPADVPPDQIIKESEVAYWITTVPVAAPAVAATPAGLRLQVGYATHAGQVREIDEDSLLIITGLQVVEGVTKPNVGILAVADGMGGHDDGQVASRRIVQVLAERLTPGLLAHALRGDTLLAETLESDVIDAVKDANRQLTEAGRASNSDMGSTLTLALVYNSQAVIANVGDSRTYLYRGGLLEQITTDHSMVAMLAAKGLISSDEIYTHPRRSEVYRVMGDKLEVEVDVFHNDLQPGDRLVLCCDGVWEMIRTDGIEEVLQAYPDDAQAACDEIVKRSNLAGGDDNISVIVADVWGYVNDDSA